jgi:NAD+ synthase (glutamine-hydrolysing)
MKIALAQTNCLIGDFEGTLKNMQGCIERARREGVELVVFPELSICGYPPLDFLEYDDFIKKSAETCEALAQSCKGISAIVGAPVINPRIEGKNLLNAALLLSEGRIHSVTAKTLLPDYDVFDEYRYFESNAHFKCIRAGGIKIALTICEDLWDVEEDKMYVRWPMEELMKEKPDLMINIAASPFSARQQEIRKRVLNSACRQFKIPLIYVNHAGAHTELVFDGGSLVMNRHGNVVLELDYFSPDFRIIDTELIDIAPAVAFDKECFTDKEGRIGLIKKALMLGIQDFFRKSGFSKAVLGLSGGVDSALVYALAIEALGKENVLGVLMPSPYSSGHSVNDALQLAENLGGATETVPINGPFEAFLTSLSGPFHGLPADITEENIQARIRAVLLMAYSNKKGYILLNTSNKSEAAVGYGTLYGDMAGSLSVIGDLYKTQVYELCRYLNREKEIIPENILCKEPSAELRPGQKDSDSLPPYDLLDQILYQYIELKQGPEAIAEKGFDPQLVKRVLALVNKNEFKRFQSPPVLRVSGKSFGIGRRMPLVGKYLTQ